MTPDEQQLLNWLPRLRRYARALVGDPDDADDLVQDTLERAWAKASLWRGVADMRAWLFSLMHHRHVDQLRRRRVPTVALEPDDPAHTPTDTALPPGTLLALENALALLPLAQREVLLLVVLEDMAYADVAQALGIPVGTVMSRLSRARERLCVLMDGGAEPARLHRVK